jgi:thiol-disulfide isomerase/thioredoxin
MSIRSLPLALAATVAFAVAASAPAQTLSVGDNAPPLTVAKFVKGEKFDRLEKDQTYVVEFWATWCGPCRVSIPHLTELQHKFKDRGVRFIGVSVWENDQSAVEPFVKQMGDKMDYSVATDVIPKGGDGQTGKMAEGWMKASESDGIPTAFIIRDGKVAWIGHPMSMDEPLSKVVSGEFDIQAAASKYREEKAAQAKLRTVVMKLRKLGPAADRKEQLAIIDGAIAEDPKLGRFLGMMKFNLLMQGDREAACAFAETVIEKATKDESETLNAIAWAIVDPAAKQKASKSEAKLALKAAVRANDLTNGENGPILDTLAKAYFDNGDAQKALECQEKAAKLIGDDNGVKDRLEQYRKAVKENNI